MVEAQQCSSPALLSFDCGIGVLKGLKGMFGTGSSGEEVLRLQKMLLIVGVWLLHQCFAYVPVIFHLLI